MVLDHWELLSLSSAFMKYSQVVFSGSSILLSRGKLTTSEHERLNTLAINFFEVSSVAKPSSPAEFRSIYKPDSNIIWILEYLRSSEAAMALIRLYWNQPQHSYLLSFKYVCLIHFANKILRWSCNTQPPHLRRTLLLRLTSHFPTATHL